jgi:catalase
VSVRKATNSWDVNICEFSRSLRRCLFGEKLAVCVSGYFESNGRGVALSKASVFKPGRVPVIGRFALAGGQPYVANEAHTIRSMAILFKTADGQEWRTGINNIPVFPVSTPEGFYELLLASAPDPVTGKPDPAKMDHFLAKHPESAKALQLIQSYPFSSEFENSTYNSLSAFRFINEQGTVIPVRWAMAAVQPFAPISALPAGQEEKNYLFDKLIASIHGHPLEWHLVITVGQSGDPTNDATLPWPPEREQIDVGTLTIDHIESEDTSPARDINFDPLVLPDGIAGSDNPSCSDRCICRPFSRPTQRSIYFAANAHDSRLSTLFHVSHPPQCSFVPYSDRS